ncbi:MAG: ATP synthase F1 subunit gamma [Chloroflexi bacterium]|nr:ATP synthase F1 subunit gamma [Chloroflexota bacterium]
MPSAREIRRRIKSVKNTGQITKAMEMVAASRMRRAQTQVVSARPYSDKMRSVLGHLAIISQRAGGQLHPLLEQRPIRRVGLVLITADRGLCGGMNSNIIRSATQFILDEAGAPVTVVAVGRKGRDFMVRHGRNMMAEFTGMPEHPGLIDTLPISKIIMDDYSSGGFDQVYLAYTQFVNTLMQKPVLRRLLPLEDIRESGIELPIDYIYEPNAETVLANLLPRYVEMQVYQAILESIASEQSARMVAMRNATDNANDIVNSLTLSYNKARQASITREITEVATAAGAL